MVISPALTRVRTRARMAPRTRLCGRSRGPARSRGVTANLCFARLGLGPWPRWYGR